MNRNRRGDQEQPSEGRPTGTAPALVGKATLTQSLPAPHTAPSTGGLGLGKQGATEALLVQRKVSGEPRYSSTSLGEQHASHTIASLFGRSTTGGPGATTKAPGAVGAPISATGSPPVQRKATDGTNHVAPDPDPRIATPKAGIDKTGFIDNSRGAPIYNRPAETDGEVACDTPLPPATRVFVSGTHPRLSHWWYITAYLEHTMVRGYVEDIRVNTGLPEPLAELRQLTSGETAERLAKEKFGSAVTDGHDLRYYENVLLYVNRGRAGITGTYQDPGTLGGGSNNVQLVAGHRIWLVSAAYAIALQSVVPSGSLTGGTVAKVKRFAGHLQDILHSVTESRNHFGEVAGEFAQAIRDRLPEIVGITAGFLMAEATSMFLAAAPTGVSQAAAAVIQLALAAFGAAGIVQATIEALKHGSAWLTTAWTAHGKPELIAEASKEFLRMLVAVAMAALSYIGAKGNYKNALTIASKMPTDGLPAFAADSTAATADAQTGTGVSLGPSVGGIGQVGAEMVKHDGETGSADAPDPAGGNKSPKSNSSAGRLIVPEGRTLSAEELAIARQLVAEGHTVEALAESSTRTADFLVDGARTELKSISNITSSDPSGALGRRILDGAGQAPHILIDLRRQAGMTQELAQRAARRAYGADRTHRIESIRLLGQGFDVTVPRVAPSGG